MKEQIKAFIRGPLGSYLISLYLRFVHLTARKVFEPPLAQVAPNGPVVYATWHGQNFIFAFYFRQRRFPTLLVALHGDGKMIGQAMAYLGVRLVFGSGRQGDRGGDKGGARAALQLLKELKNGHSVTLTADVPKIARKAGPGVILIARKAGVPIVPVAMTTSRRRILKTWDRMQLPLPFSRMVFVTGKALSVPNDASPSDSYQTQLDAELDRIQARAFDLAAQ